MSEEYILRIIPERIKQLGYRNYHIRYRDLTIQPSKTEILAAHTELWFIVDDPQGLVIESDYGIYDSTGAYLFDNSHIHKGDINIINSESESKRVKFIQVIIVN